MVRVTKIQKVKNISNLAKNQFYIKNHKKIYTILTFSKISEINGTFTIEREKTAKKNQIYFYISNIFFML